MIMEYLKVWTSFREIIEPLTDAEKGRLFVAMLEYAESGIEPQLSGNERYVWPSARQSINNTRDRSEQMKANGSKPKQTESNRSKTKQNEENANYKVNIKENIKETILTDSKEKRDRFSTPTVEDVSAYCRERGNSVDPQRFVDFYASKGWRVGNQPMKDWKACVRTWEQRDSAQPAQRAKVLMAQDYQQREYKESEMAAALGVNDLFKGDAAV
jgi:hypothetical protein